MKILSRSIIHALFFVLLFLLLCSGCTSHKLIDAAYHDDMNALQSLIGEGGDINERDGMGYTPLMWAVYNNYENVVQYLIDHGADMDLQNNDGKTALIMAAYQDSHAIVKRLLAGGADVNIRDNKGHKALEVAAFHKNTETITLIQQYDNDPIMSDILSRSENMTEVFQEPENDDSKVEVTVIRLRATTWHDREESKDRPYKFIRLNDRKVANLGFGEYARFWVNPGSYFLVASCYDSIVNRALSRVFMPSTHGDIYVVFTAVPDEPAYFFVSEGKERCADLEKVGRDEALGQIKYFKKIRIPD